MADQGIKNVIIKKELLGKVTSNNSRIARFRIVAEDKNRKSAWSQILIVDSQLVEVLPGDIAQVGNTIFVNWSNGSNPTEQIKYDIFAKFDSGSTDHIGTSVGTSFSFLKKAGAGSVRVIVQLASLNPVVSQSIHIFDSGVRVLV